MKKKTVILILIVLACIFIAGCSFDDIHYCPYCKSTKVELKDSTKLIYKCGKCSKEFGAKQNPIVP